MDFPGSPVVKTPCSHGRGCGFNPWDPWSGKFRQGYTQGCSYLLSTKTILICSALASPRPLLRIGPGSWGGHRIGCPTLGRACCKFHRLTAPPPTLHAASARSVCACVELVLPASSVRPGAACGQPWLFSPASRAACC